MDCKTEEIVKNDIVNIENKNLLAIYIKQIFEALRGKEQDYTSLKVNKAIILLSVPMVLEMLMESLFAIVDIYFVSKIGEEAIASVGLTESVMTLIYAIGIGLAMATTAIVSRRIGEKNIKEATNSAYHSIIIAVIISLVISIFGIIISKDILIIMGASERILNYHSGYMTIMLGGNVTIMLLFIINAVFRSAGDAMISLKVLWLANIINIILDPLFIFGWGPIPKMGVEGAAVATNIGRGVAIIYQFYNLVKGNGKIKFKGTRFHKDWGIIKNILKLSLGGMSQNIIATSSWIGLMRIVSLYGSVALAGYTISLRILFFTLLPSLGFANAASTLVGQNLGASKPERAERSVNIIAKVSAITMGLISLALIIFAETFIGLFVDGSEVLLVGASSLRILGYGFIFYAVGMVLIHAFNGAGDTFTPTYINIFCYWLLEIPLAYILAVILNFRADGVFYAILISEGIMTITAYIIFRIGKWKKKIV